MKWNRPARLLLIHVTIWAIYIGCEITAIYLMNRVPLKASTIYFYGCNIAAFYVELYILGAAFFTRPRLTKTILTLVNIGVWTIVKLAIEYFVIFSHLPVAEREKLMLQVYGLDLFRTVNYVGMGALYWFGGNVSRFEREAYRSKINELTAMQRRSQVEIELAESKNAFLQQQLNPHLLFNTLNFIYSSVLKHSDEAAKAVLLLADIMRYSLDGADGDGKVALADELDNLQKLIDITGHRYEGGLQLSYQQDGEPGDLRIIPLILLTLTENIFKHGILNRPDLRATIFIEIAPSGTFRLLSGNFKKAQTAFQRTSSIGMRNLRARLDHTYLERYSLTTKDLDDRFELNLTITL